MGNKISTTNYNRILPQASNFVSECRINPIAFKIKYEYDSQNSTSVWKCDNMVIYKTNNNIELIDCDNILILSACVYSGSKINHVLDGYSWGVIVNMNTVNNIFEINITSHNIENDKLLFIEEENGRNLKTGLFTSDMSIYKKICLGNLPKILKGDIIVERSTAHQPIYYPQTNSILYCSLNKYHSIKNHNSKITSGWEPKFTKKEYACMHPHYDYESKELLTYTFVHGVLKKYTKIKFIAYGDDPKTPTIVNYKIDERVTLHMFGYTRNYYIIFANPLKLEKGGECNILCGKPLLRALDDDYVGDLIIHFIPRPHNTKKSFSINTTHKGHIYHSINCFELENNIIIDAFVSNLNALREASQFELDEKYKVYDNYGDPYRFYVTVPIDNNNKKDFCKEKLLASLIDSTIDFHCINMNYSGKEHSFIWILGHERIRNENGEIVKVISTLSKVYISDNYNFNNNKSVTHVTISTDHSSKSCYWRTPLFIPRKNSLSEDDGYIFIWSHELSLNLHNSVCILIFSAKNLELITKLRLPENYIIPYSVHSWIHYN
jgi:carotenoid cleavage dioxygenase-like enzyme